MSQPDVDQIRSNLSQLHSDMRNDPGLAERFALNAGQVMSERGITDPAVQSDIMRESAPGRELGMDNSCNFSMCFGTNCSLLGTNA